MTEIAVRRSEPKPSKVFDTYFHFAAERQAIYYRKLRGEKISTPACPWDLTSDPILAAHRFTNVFRASDRVSQHLIRSVIYDGEVLEPVDVVFRILLFKMFNRIGTWEHIVKVLGRQPLGLHCEFIAQVLDLAKGRGETLYSGAYVMPSPGNAPCKHRAHVALASGVASHWYDLVCTKSLAELYLELSRVQSFGPFLAYQLAIDLNYSELFSFDEDEFVVPGPGARDGLRKCFESLGDYSEADAIRWTCERADQEFARLGLEPVRLFGRRLHLIDCQNLFCEVDKYAREAHPEVRGISGRTKIKQLYKPNPESMPIPFFPPKWELQP